MTNSNFGVFIETYLFLKWEVKNSFASRFLVTLRKISLSCLFYRATNPSQFEIEFFVNDLSKPGASTFESLGGLEYKQNVHIQLECERKQIPTDGLVLRGWYTTITLAVYGTLTKSLNNPPEVTPPAASSTVCVSGSEETPECVTQIPEQPAEWYYENPAPANPTVGTFTWYKNQL